MRTLALILTVLTGFAGLVYEVTWQKYLATLLGSHSEATAAVLAIFLGGLALGYGLFGRISRRAMERDPANGPARLIFIYGCVECAIGLYAWIFSLLFRAGQELSLRIPHGSEAFAFGADLALSALLIGPPAVLMGSSIPLLTQSLSRGLEDATRLHALVYAANTMGATAGALCAGFWLVPQLGLRTTLLMTGALSLSAGAVFVAFSGLGRRTLQAGQALPAPVRAALPEGVALYAVVAGLGGFALMTLQTVANRIGALALGGSQFTFAAVVSVFVLCIALGSFAVSALSRIHPYTLIASQWLLVLSLLTLYLGVEDAPYWAYALRIGFSNGPESFYPYYLAVSGMLLLVCIVPLGLAGATLPLLFDRLRREDADLGAVAGKLYGWNTVGSVLGAVLGGYALLFWLDLDQIFRIAVGCVALGAALLSARLLPRRRLAALAGLATVVGVLALQPEWSAKQLTPGLFRKRAPIPYAEAGPQKFFEHWAEGWGDYILFYADDPALSVAVFQTGSTESGPNRSIIVNGKSDGNIPQDNRTMGLLSLLPALFAERCETAFVIGFGTGMSAGELAALDSTNEVVIAEISPSVIEAAPFFEPFNRGALASEKTRIVRSDAYRALLRSEARYDVIVSEPSNPWVTGVEMLYSREFLRAARARLTPGGVFAQWFHTYETDAASLSIVLKTYLEAFDLVSVWVTGQSDLVILGFEAERHEVDLETFARRVARPDFRGQLEAIGIRSLPELLAYEILPLGVLNEIELPGPTHTLLHPVLSDAAARAFFVGETAQLPPSYAGNAAALGAERSLARRFKAKLSGGALERFRHDLLRETCGFNLELCTTLFAEWKRQAPDSMVLAQLLVMARDSEQSGVTAAVAPEHIEALASLFEAGPGGDASYAFAKTATETFARHYHHAAPFAPDALLAPWQRCSGDPRCDRAQDVLEANGVPVRPSATTVSSSGGRVPPPRR